MTFTVTAYPNRSFSGTVGVHRSFGNDDLNVVTYTVIAVDPTDVAAPAEHDGHGDDRHRAGRRRDAGVNSGALVPAADQSAMVLRNGEPRACQSRRG